MVVRRYTKFVTGSGIRRCIKISGGPIARYMALDVHDAWQRDTAHPSTQALLGFLEADLRRGMSVIGRAALECGSGRAVSRDVAAELDTYRPR